MKDYINYMVINLKGGKLTTGILIILTLIIYTIFLMKLLVIPAILSLIIGGAISISYSNYRYDKKNIK